MVHLYPAREWSTMQVIYLLLGFITIKCAEASDGCRTLVFEDCVKDKALVNHTVETSRVLCPGLDQCQHKCFMNDACVSYNLGPIEGMLRTCELSDTDHVGHPNHVVPKEGSEYCAIKNPCSSSQCKANYMTCKPDFSWDSFVCAICGKALGMEDGRVPDSAITASSFWNLGHEPFQGRLHYKAPFDLGYYSSSCWTAKVNKAGEYLQVDLGREFYVTKVATQGRLNSPQWVKSYSLKYSLDGSTWTDYQQDGTAKIFQANSDRETVVTHELADPFKGQFVRIVVQSWNSHISMRMELYGCEA